MADERFSDWMEESPKSWVQPLFEESAVQRHPLGTVRRISDGRAYAYAKAGANLTAGKLTVAVAPVGNHTNIAVATAASVGDKRVSVTLGATAAAADLYKEGFLHVNASNGLGHLYKIRGHLAIAASGTGWIELYDKLRIALTTSSRVSLTQNLQANVTFLPAATGVATAAIAGVPPIAVTANYFFWNQVKGPCPVLVRGTVVVGNIVVPDWTAASGAEGAVVAAADHAALIKGGPIGQVMKVNSTAEYALINLDIPGY